LYIAEEVMRKQSLVRLFASILASALPLSLVQCSDNNALNCSGNTRTVPLGDAGFNDGGLDCVGLCQGGSNCSLNADGKTVMCQLFCGGRRPLNLAPPKASAGSSLSGFFVELAYLEAASVHAFRALAGELAALRAPSRLVRAAHRAKRDEIRHARVTSALARRFGGVPCWPVMVRKPGRAPLVDIAIENAVEGCVRETFGALVAHWQAGHAADTGVRAAMARIARDETAHAALAWQIHAWARSQLNQAELRRVKGAMRTGIDGLAAPHEAELPVEILRFAGMPGSAVKAALKSALAQRLWHEDAGVGRPDTRARA
jgi:hypothetical protein